MIKVDFRKKKQNERIEINSDREAFRKEVVEYRLLNEIEKIKQRSLGLAVHLCECRSGLFKNCPGGLDEIDKIVRFSLAFAVELKKINTESPQ